MPMLMLEKVVHSLAASTSTGRGQEFVVYCFKEQSDAELFQMHFDGELMTPETRPPKYPNAPFRPADRVR